MALPTSTSSVSYAGNGSTSTLYPVPFVFFLPTDLTVLVADSSGNVTTLANGTDYTVTGGGFDQTGNISTTVAYDSTKQITISRNVPYTQATSLTTGDEFPAVSMEQALDNLVMQTQQLSRAVGNSIQVADTVLTKPNQLTTVPQSGQYSLGVNGGSVQWIPQATESLTNASNSSVTSTGSTTARTLSDRFTDVINVKDFGAKGDGITDDTAAIQAALNYCYSLGGGFVYANGKFLINSNITIPTSVTLQGSIEDVGQKNVSQKLALDIANSTIRLNSSATINMSPASGLQGFLIYNSNLIGSTPFLSQSEILTAISNYSGISITITGADDVLLNNLLIVGFNKAVYQNGNGRQKFTWLEIDCTNGIEIQNAHDIGRLENIHMWPFLTQGYGYDITTTARSGSGFYIHDGFDAGCIVNSFVDGYFYGYNLLGNTGSNGVSTIVFINCFRDYIGNANNDNGQVGWNIQGNVYAKIIGCGISASSYGIYSSVVSGIAPNIHITNTHFNGNKWHFYSAGHNELVIDGCRFQYQNQNSGWGPGGAIYMNSAANSYSIITSNIFNGGGSGIAISMTARDQRTAIVKNNQYYGGYVIPSVENSYSLDGTNFEENFGFGNQIGNKLSYYTARGTGSSPSDSQSADIPLTRTYYVSVGGTNYAIATDRFQIPSAPTSSSTPGVYVLGVTNNGATSPTDRIVVESAGNLRPAQFGAQSLGTSAYGWNGIYVAFSTSGAATVSWTSGTGSPNGVVTANVGSLYTDNAGSTSTTLYVKTSGTGNTGWTAK